MRIFLTGASGHIASALIPELITHGHQVLGLARSDAAAEKVAALGADVQRGDLYDPAGLAAAARETDGVIHLAFDHASMFGGDREKAVDADLTVLHAFGDALAGTDKPLIGTGGSLMLASVAAFLLISLAGAFHSGFMLTKMIALLPILTYATVYIGMLDVPKIPFYHRGDYSYGVYLYGFPLQQGLMAAFPRSFNIATHYICSVLITTLFAMFSWHCIEKPILRQRRRFSFTARKTEEAEQRLPKSEGGSALERV